MDIGNLRSLVSREGVREFKRDNALRSQTFGIWPITHQWLTRRIPKPCDAIQKHAQRAVP